MHTKHWKLHVLSIALLLVWVKEQADAQVLVEDGPEEGKSDRFDVKIDVLATPYTLTFTLNDTENYFFENITCRSGNTQEIIANEHHICENLYPCSVYVSVVTVREKDGEKNDQTISSNTEYKEPRTEIVSVEATADSIQLTWETTDRACVRHFEIMAKSPESSDSTQQLNDMNSHIFKGLQPCQYHNITLNTFSDNSNEPVDRDNTEKTTSYAEPGELTLNITNLSNGRTSITWNEPEHRTCIGNYTLRWRRNDCEVKRSSDTTENTLMPTTLVPPDEEDGDVQCEWTEFKEDPTLKKFELADLQGCELHTFGVFINVNKTAKGSEEFVSAEKMPSAVTNPFEVISPTELRWEWTVPTNNPKCVASYRVNLTGPTQRPQFDSKEQITSETFMVFDKLDPCGTYEAMIVPISLNGSIGGSYRSDITLSEDQPSRVLEPQAIPGSYSIELSWQTPTYADLCITVYRISGWMDSNIAVDALSRDTAENNVLFESGLSSCRAYTIQIIPTTQNMDGELLQIEIETEAAIVDTNKIELQLVKSDSRSLELNARNQDNNNSCQTIFAHFYCSTTANVPYNYSEKYAESHTQSFGFQATLTPLSPFTSYVCYVLLYNVAGPSQPKRLANLQTGSYFPEQPKQLLLINSSISTLTFRWEPPTYPNGLINLYQVYLMRIEPAYFVPPDCQIVSEDPVSAATGSLEYTFTNLLPATKYSMQVAAKNDFGIGQYSSPEIFETLPDVSEKVTDVLVEPAGPLPQESGYSANVTVSWKMPCRSNGEIEKFQVEFWGQRDQNETNFSIPVPPDTHIEGRMTYVETDLLPEYIYRVEVTVKNVNVERLSASVSETFEAPSGIPARLGSEVVDNMRVNAYETNHPTSSAIVHLPGNVLNSDSGNIKYIALLVSEKNCGGVPQMRYDALDSARNWPIVLSWQEAVGDAAASDCIRQYQSTPVRWQPETSESSRNAEVAEIVYTIGVDKCTNTNEYCNGPLRADTEYNLVVRLFTRSGYNDAALLEFKTDKAVKVTLILVSVCSCLLLAFIIGLLVLWVRKRIAWHRDSGQGIEDPFGNVIAKNFAIFYAEVAKPEKLAREFKEITVVALELSYASSELGCHKNRYADIYPYDKNRVILDIDAEGSDYINASFIDGHTRKKEYIATQGPKPESVMDFWRMILQHNVRIIVQVTQFREGNMVKCHEYFPYNMRGLSVTAKAKESFELYDRTELSVVHENYGLKEKVIHFFFKKWPDHGCPEDPMHLITFVRKVKAERRPSYSPIVVHCSAGVGRTGTFIGLDLIMQRLKSESKINIFETVKKLRFQRMKMVQTQQQYTFLYACTYELVKHKIPRDVRAKSPAPPAKRKTVSFPDTAADAELSSAALAPAVLAAPNGEDTNAEMLRPKLLLPSRFGGFRKTQDLDSLREHPERNSYGTGNESGDSPI